MANSKNSMLEAAAEVTVAALKWFSSTNDNTEEKLEEERRKRAKAENEARRLKKQLKEMRAAGGQQNKGFDTEYNALSKQLSALQCDRNDANRNFGNKDPTWFPKSSNLNNSVNYSSQPCGNNMGGKVFNDFSSGNGQQGRRQNYNRGQSFKSDGNISHSQNNGQGRSWHGPQNNQRNGGPGSFQNNNGAKKKDFPSSGPSNRTNNDNNGGQQKKRYYKNNNNQGQSADGVTKKIVITKTVTIRKQ